MTASAVDQLEHSYCSRCSDRHSHSAFIVPNPIYSPSLTIEHPHYLSHIPYLKNPRKSTYAYVTTKIRSKTPSPAPRPHVPPSLAPSSLPHLNSSPPAP